MKLIKPLVQNRDTVVVDVGTSVVEAARLMSEKHIGAVPVLDGGRLAGIFTERDVLSRIVGAGVDPATTTVSSVMTTDLVTADVGESHEVCMRRMQQAHVRHLIVLDGGRLAGILSVTSCSQLLITASGGESPSSNCISFTERSLTRNLSYMHMNTSCFHLRRWVRVLADSYNVRNVILFQF